MILFGYLLMCLIFGTTFLAIKVGIDAGAAPFFSAGLRFFIAGLTLYLWMVWRGKAKASMLWRKEMLFTGTALTFGTFSTLYWAEQYVASGLAAVLSATGPMMILLIQRFVLGQKTSRQSAAGCAVGFAGVLLLVLPGLSLDNGSWMWLVGCAAVLVGEFSYCSGALYSKQVTRRFPETSPIALNAVQMLYGGALLLVLSAFTEGVRFGSLFSLQGTGSLLYLIVLGSMVGHSLFYWLVAKTDPVFPSTWLYSSPLIAMGLGHALYQEPLSWVTVAGGFTIITGIILVNAEALAPAVGRLMKARVQA